MLVEELPAPRLIVSYQLFARGTNIFNFIPPAVLAELGCEIGLQLWLCSVCCDTVSWRKFGMAISDHDGVQSVPALSQM
jgi:hypothetical protein